MAKYMDKLGATFIVPGGGYTEDDVRDTQNKLKVVRSDTIRMHEILTFQELMGSPVSSDGLIYAFIFRIPSG